MDARVSRRFPEGIDLIRTNRDRLGQAVVICLGHNYGGGGSVYGYLDELMVELRGVDRVVFVTVAEWSPAQIEVNRAIRALPAFYPNVVVADWQRRQRRQPAVPGQRRRAPEPLGQRRPRQPHRGHARPGQPRRHHRGAAPDPATSPTTPAAARRRPRRARPRRPPPWRPRPPRLRAPARPPRRCRPTPPRPPSAPPPRPNPGRPPRRAPPRPRRPDPTPEGPVAPATGSHGRHGERLRAGRARPRRSSTDRRVGAAGKPGYGALFVRPGLPGRHQFVWNRRLRRPVPPGSGTPQHNRTGAPPGFPVRSVRMSETR